MRQTALSVNDIAKYLETGNSQHSRAKLIDELCEMVKDLERLDELKRQDREEAQAAESKLSELLLTEKGEKERYAIYCSLRKLGIHGSVITFAALMEFMPRQENATLLERAELEGIKPLQSEETKPL